MGPEATQAFDSVLVIFIWAAGITASISILAAPFFYAAWWVKRNNIKKSEDLIEQNAQIVEEATFFKYNGKYNDIIQKQLEEMKDLHNTKKKLQDEITDLEKEKEKKSKK